MKKFLNSLRLRYAKTSSKRYIKWLRAQGCVIGERVEFHGIRDISIDTTRPSLIEIGDDVIFTRGVSILTHGYDWFVLRNMYHEILASSGRVKIGNNVFLGSKCIILKGITIGDNVIIGAGSVVTKNIPSNCVAVGNPAKVIMTMQEYYLKRKSCFIDEAFAYANSIKKNLLRNPVDSDFWEEFPLFLEKNQSIDGINIETQLGNSASHYHIKHTPIFNGIDDFLDKAGIDVSK